VSSGGCPACGGLEFWIRLPHPSNHELTRGALCGGYTRRLHRACRRTDHTARPCSAASEAQGRSARAWGSTDVAGGDLNLGA
jgi:hypothetical protein